MPIVAGDMLIKFSVKTGSAGNSTAGTAAGSLGKYISTTQWTGGTLHDLFDLVSASESGAGDIEYRCLFVHNNHGSLQADSCEVFIQAETAGGATIALASDNIAASAIGSASAQAAEVADENTAPSGVSSFSSPTGTPGVSLGNIPSGQCKAFWIKRTVAASTGAQSGDGFTLRLRFLTV